MIGNLPSQNTSRLSQKKKKNKKTHPQNREKHESIQPLWDMLKSNKKKKANLNTFWLQNIM